MADKRKVLASEPGRRMLRKMVVVTGCLVLIGAGQLVNVPLLTDLNVIGVNAAYAQKAKREKPKTRRADTVGKKVGEQLIKAQEAQAEDRFAEAMSILQRLSTQKLSPYESAVIWRQIGYVYTQQERYSEALRAFEKAFNYKSLDETQQLDLQFFLGQLYLAEDRVNDAIRTLEDWLRASGPDAAPNAYFVLAQAYSVKESYSRALSYAEQGMTKARAAGSIRENWYRITTNLYLQEKKYRSAQNLLKEMLRLFPGKKSYWNQLGATYSLLEQDSDAYYMRLMMYQQGMLSKSSELELMANLNIYNEVPYRAVKVLKKGFAEGKVTKNADNYELYATSFQESREWKDAIAPLTEAAKLSEDGDLYMRRNRSI
jgi:tetratricopeptide (TPR) repeat protein